MKTASNNVVIKEVFGRKGVEYAKSIGGVFSLRLSYTNKHFGNPFSHKVKTDGIVMNCKSVEASVIAYFEWILTDKYNKQFPQLIERRNWIRQIINSGILKGKPIVYYKELNECSHANVLDALINTRFINDFNEVKKTTK